MSTPVIPDLFNGMEGYNPTHIQLILNLIKTHGWQSTSSLIAKLNGYREIPPTIDQFIEDDKYLGKVLDHGNVIFKVWRQKLRDIFPNEFTSPHFEIIFGGAIGIGKTFISIIGFLYEMCRILLLEHPQKKFGLSPTTPIVFALFNRSLRLGKEVLVSQVEELINGSPFFLGEMAKSSGGNTRFPNNIDLFAGSRFEMALGKAVISAILDELNFHDVVKNQADETYNAIKTRLSSRFEKQGQFPAHLWLISSKTDETGWLQNHIKEVRSDNRVFIFEPPQWEILKEKEGKYSGKTFKMFVGDQYRDPFIVERLDQVRDIHPSDILDVPIEYLDDFRRDPLRSLQDIAGRGTWSSMRFISSVELIEECQIRVNPVTREVITLDFFDKNQKIIEYLSFVDMVVDSRSRFIHLDLGLKNDKTGITSTRFDGQVTINRFDAYTGKHHTLQVPIYHVDFIMYIEARPGQEVSIPKIRDFLFDLRARGYPVAYVSADGYQSKNLLQDLTNGGFLTQELSVDKKKNAYYYLRDVILDGCLSCVRHPLLTKELKELLDTRKKIDHPSTKDGSKDGSDSLAGSVYNAYLHQDIYQTIFPTSDYLQNMESHLFGEPNTLYDFVAGNAIFSVPGW